MFVIIDTATRCKIRHPRTYVEYYKTERAAKASITRIKSFMTAHLLAGDNNHAKEVPDLVVMNMDDYQKQVPLVERINFITGEKYMELSDTPHYCSPSSETYWSM